MEFHPTNRLPAVCDRSIQGGLLPNAVLCAGGGNPSLLADPDWIGFNIPPNHPEYPAAHGCFSGSVV